MVFGEIKPEIEWAHRAMKLQIWLKQLFANISTDISFADSRSWHPVQPKSL